MMSAQLKAVLAMLDGQRPQSSKKAAFHDRKFLEAKAQRMYDRNVRKYFASWEEWCEHVKSERMRCLRSWRNRLRYYSKADKRYQGELLRWAWKSLTVDEMMPRDVMDAQGGVREEGGGGAEVMEDVLHRLQAAVVDTHTTHSRLLEIVHKEEQLKRLLERVAPEVSRAITNAGITSVPELTKIHAEKGDRGLESLGIEQAPQRAALVRLLEDPASLDLRGSQDDIFMAGSPDSTAAGARAKLADEMAALRAKLEIRQKILAAELDTRKPYSGDVKQVFSAEEENLNLMNSLLEKLGGTPLPLSSASVASAKADDKSKESTSVDGVNDEKGVETEGDRETTKYMDRLKAEGDAQQAILQLLAKALGEDKILDATQEQKEDAEEAKKERSLLAVQQKAMEDALKQVSIGSLS